MNPIANDEYTICIETFFNEYKLWEKATIDIEGISVHIQPHSTQKFSSDAGTYYTRTIAQFRKRGFLVVLHNAY